jgi:hypothetical protein
MTMNHTDINQSAVRAIHPDGTEEILPDAELETLQKAVGGWIDYLPEAFHGLTTHEVVVSDEGEHEDPNLFAARAIGLDLAKCYAPRGVVVLVPLETPNHEERKHQESWFALAGVDPALVNHGDIIDFYDGEDD